MKIKDYEVEKKVSIDILAAFLIVVNITAMFIVLALSKIQHVFVRKLALNTLCIEPEPIIDGRLLIVNFLLLRKNVSVTGVRHNRNE